MAKKQASGFNMSQEIRDMLSKDSSMTSRAVYETLLEKHPGQEVKRSSCNVAYSQARKKLGLNRGPGKKRRAVRKRRPSKVASTGRVSMAATGGDAVDFALLKTARALLAEAGSAERAIQSLKQLEALQID